jgi:CRISPR-associated protein Csm1
MEDNVFQSALAGLLAGFGEFARKANQTGPVLNELIPARWSVAVYTQGDPFRLHAPLDQLVSRADQLVAGNQGSSAGNGQPTQLHSIFSGIVGLRDEAGQPIGPPPIKYRAITELKIDEQALFLQEPSLDIGQAYQTLWDHFAQAAKDLKKAYEDPAADREAYLDNLLGLMQRYCWSIPAAYKGGQSDVSLYDHSRMTGALAACLAHPKASGNHEEVALLVGGDISGVQKFIYTITSRGATSGLRGRSMYLQLLTEVIARYLLNELGLPLTNLIYSGGGHFYLLAPANSDLASVKKYASQVLLHHHQGDLYLALAPITLHAQEFSGPALSNKWRELTQALQEAKQRQFSELDGAALLDLFAPQEHGGGEEKVCAVCQREHPDTTKETEDEPAKCPVCRSFEDLGETLRRARYYCLEQRSPAQLVGRKGSGEHSRVLAHFGYRASFKPTLAKIGSPSAPAIRRTVLALDEGGLAELSFANQQVIGRHFLVNITPFIASGEEYQALKNKGVEDLPGKFEVETPPIKTFGAMTAQAQGIKRLGILRMDVDNLGQIFSRGLGSEATLARIAALSFAFRLFFEGWVSEIAKKLSREQQSDLIYSIYSGGDDLFFVGAWQLMPLLAERIKDDLHTYTGGHPGIHLSGGVALAGSKYPLYQAAEDAHEAEQAAKAKRADGQRKNALNFLGQTIPWDRFAEIKQCQVTMAELVTSEKAPAGLLQRLNRLYAEYEQANRELAQKGQSGKVYWGPWHWHGAYSLSRLEERVAKKDEQAAAEIKAIREALRLEEFKNIEWIGLAARWAELLVRE